MSLASRMLVLGTILVAGGCDGWPTSSRGYGEDEIRVTASAPNLTITNESDQRIVYVVMTTDLLALSLIGLTGWPSINPGATVSLEYSEIAGYQAGEKQEVGIHWARVTGTQDGPSDPASIKVLRVPLH